MRRYKCATIKYRSFLKRWGEKHSLFRWSPFADIFQPLHMLDVAIIFSKCLGSWQAARPMRSYQNNPSPSDTMESVCRHFPPPSLSKSVSLLRNEMRRVRWTLSTATRLRRIRWSPLADIGNFLVISSFQTDDQSGTSIKLVHDAKLVLFFHNVEELSGPKRSIKITFNFTCTSANVINWMTCTYCNKL